MLARMLRALGLVFAAWLLVAGCSSGDDDEHAKRSAPVGQSCWHMGESCDPSKGRCCDTDKVNLGCRDGTCQVCAVLQNACGQDADCCDGARCMEGACCSLRGGCKTDGDCCGAWVCGGPAGCCLPSGAGTTAETDCCSGQVHDTYDKDGNYEGSDCL